MNLLKSLLLGSNEIGYNIINTFSRIDFYKFCNNFTINNTDINQNIDNLNLGYLDYLHNIENNEDNYDP